MNDCITQNYVIMEHHTSTYFKSRKISEMYIASINSKNFVTPSENKNDKNMSPESLSSLKHNIVKSHKKDKKKNKASKPARLSKSTEDKMLM